MVHALPGEVTAALATFKSKTSIGTAPPLPSATYGSEIFNASRSSAANGCSPMASLTTCTPAQESTTCGATACVSEQPSDVPTELVATTR